MVEKLNICSNENRLGYRIAFKKLENHLKIMGNGEIPAKVEKNLEKWESCIGLYKLSGTGNERNGLVPAPFPIHVPV